MRNFSPSRQWDSMLAVWSELEKIRAQAQQVQDERSTGTVPRLVQLPKSSSLPAAFTSQPVGSVPDPLPSTPPTVGPVRRSGAGGDGAHSSSSSGAARRPSSNDLALPELPAEAPDEWEPASGSPVPNHASPTLECGRRRPSFIGEESKQQVREFRRRVSRKLSKLAENVSDWVQKASPRSGRNSPEHSSPTGRSSSVQSSPRASATSNMDSVARPAVVDMYIDFDAEPYSTLMNQSMQFAEAAWQKPSGDKGHAYAALNEKEKRILDACFHRMFIRDTMAGTVSLRLNNGDGSSKPVTLLELARYLHPDNEAGNTLAGDPGDSEIKEARELQFVSLFLSQQVANSFSILGCGGHPDIPAVFFLDDGTPILPRGKPTITWTIQRFPEGHIKADYVYECKPDPVPNGRKSVSKTDNRQIDVNTDAELRISTGITFKSGEAPVFDKLHVTGKGWNKGVRL